MDLITSCAYKLSAVFSILTVNATVCQPVCGIFDLCLGVSKEGISEDDGIGAVFQHEEIGADFDPANSDRNSLYYS
jgi:hypothetical protein